MWNTASVIPSERAQIEARAAQDVVVRVQEIAQHGEQVLANAADHLLADERDIGRILELERDAAFVLHDGDAGSLVAAQDLADVVVGRAGVQHGERALSPQLVEPTLARVAKLACLDSRENLEAAFRGNQRVHRVSLRAVAPLGANLDRRRLARHEPDIDHVGIADGDTAVGPVRA